MIKKVLNLAIIILSIAALISLIKFAMRITWVILEITVLLTLIRTVIKYRNSKSNTKSDVLEIVVLSIMLVGGIVLII